MSKITLIGQDYLVAPLAATGIDVFACASARQGCERLTQVIKNKDHSIIFITESIAQDFMPEIEAAEKEEVNIVLLPDHKGSLGLFRERLRGLINKAAGAAKYD